MGAETKFDDAMMKADAKGGCAQTGDAAAIEDVVDGCVNDVLGAIPSTVLPSCRTATITCSCNDNVMVTTRATCGDVLDCATVRSDVVSACTSHGGSRDCDTVDCTDVCTSQPCK
jgi:hypothetical protein